MKRPLLLALFALLLIGLAGARAQFGSFGDVPIEINAEETRFEGGIAVAEGNVVIRYAETTLYCDYAQYNPDTHDVLVSGNVRIFRGSQVFSGERAIYNLETKALTAADFRGSFTPFQFGGETLGTLTANAYRVQNGLFTTSDNSKPDYVIRARGVRIYPNDRVIFTGVKLYVGKTPVFWFPYIYQSLNKEQGFSLSPGYSSVLGAFLLTRYTFPLSENVGATFRFDLMSERGVGVGFDSDWESGKDSRDWGRFRTYYVHDLSPQTTRTRIARETIDPNRYRVSLQNRTYLTDNIYASIDINKLSDARFLEDFEPGEFRQNPNPDNMIALTAWNEDYTLTLTGRAQFNEFFDTTERLPDLALDLKRRPLFGTNVFYEGESSVGYLRRNFADISTLADYDTIRADSFHQFLYPVTVGGWLSFIPRVGFRGTFYSDSGRFEEETLTIEREEELSQEDLRLVAEGLTPEGRRIVTTTETRRTLREGGSVFRPTLNAGFESSFKLSRAYEGVQSRTWGLDGLRHVFQPWMNFSYVWTNQDPNDLFQFDRLNPSTQRPLLDFPQFNATDSISSWAIVRLGVRNRFQTRRDNTTFNWLELNTYFDVNIDQLDYPGFSNPDPGTFSNVYNRLRWLPLPWVSLDIDSQLPLLDTGFTEVNSRLSFVVNPSVQLSIGHRYISGNPFILDSNQLNFGGYVRMGDHWGFSFREVYQFDDAVLEQQRYELHRDLSSWIASLGFVVNDNRGVNDYGLLLTFTLKDLPSVRLPLAFDPAGTGTTGSNRSR
jgi:LPS-assembly protein